MPAVGNSGGSTEANCGAAFLEGAQWGSYPLDGAPNGRLRAVRPGPDGALYVTTSNGDDEVLRVSPA